jgi:DNA polymerase-3 subunit delta'
VPSAPDTVTANGTAEGTDGGTDAWADVLGQERAVSLLRSVAAEPLHAYLLVGPNASDRIALARAFAADVLAHDPGIDDPDRARRLALGELHGDRWQTQHSDLKLIEPVGAAIAVKQAQEIVRQALMHPTEGTRKVVVLPNVTRFEVAGPALLKTIEEPPPSTVFVLLADDVPPELVTIASRCVRVELELVPDHLIQQQIEAEGVEPALAADLAAAASGDIARARLLRTDEAFAARRAAWAAVPLELDGTGATVGRLVDGLLAMIEAAAEPVKVAQATELEELEQRAERYGEKIAKKPVEDDHKRTLRRLRTAELRFGLQTLARHYAGRLTGDRPDDAVLALRRLHDAGEALIRNPNEALLLQALFLRLPH